LGFFKTQLSFYLKVTAQVATKAPRHKG